MDTSTPVYISEGEDEFNIAAALDRNVTYGLPDLPSDNEIVPDDDQAILIAIREKQTLDCFAIGDIANRLTERAIERWVQSQDKNQKRVTAQRVRGAVGRFCGKSERTVRYYAETAAFYDEEARSRYEILPFSHFVFARSIGERWRDVLEYALLNPASTLVDLNRVFIQNNSLAVSLFGATVAEPASVAPVETPSSVIGNGANIRTLDTASYSLESGPVADYIKRGFEGVTKSGPAMKVNTFGDLLTALDRADEFVRLNVNDAKRRDAYLETSSALRDQAARVLEVLQ